MKIKNYAEKWWWDNSFSDLYTIQGIQEGI